MKYEFCETNETCPSIGRYRVEAGRGDMLTELKDERLTITFRVRDDIRRTGSRFRLTDEETARLKELLLGGCECGRSDCKERNGRVMKKVHGKWTIRADVRCPKCDTVLDATDFVREPVKFGDDMEVEVECLNCCKFIAVIQGIEGW